MEVNPPRKRYTYVSNNLVMLWDPDGRKELNQGPGGGGGVPFSMFKQLTGKTTVKAKPKTQAEAKPRSKEPPARRKTFNTRKEAKEAATRAGKGKKPNQGMMQMVIKMIRDRILDCVAKSESLNFFVNRRLKRKMRTPYFINCVLVDII